jgi:hypothetical protein
MDFGALLLLPKVQLIRPVIRPPFSGQVYFLSKKFLPGWFHKSVEVSGAFTKFYLLKLLLTLMVLNFKKEIPF